MLFDNFAANIPADSKVIIHVDSNDNMLHNSKKASIIFFDGPWWRMSVLDFLTIRHYKLVDYIYEKGPDASYIIHLIAQ